MTKYDKINIHLNPIEKWKDKHVSVHLDVNIYNNNI